VVPRDVFVRPSRSFGWVVESRKPDGRVSTWWWPTKGVAKGVARRLGHTELGTLSSPHGVPVLPDDGNAEATRNADSG
jgi:hypothetical protein